MRRRAVGGAVTAPSPSRALSVRQVGPDLDEDVWDRVVALWRDPAGEGVSSPAPARAAALRAAVRAGRVTLLLVTDGPRLLGFAAVTEEPCQLREVRVRAGAPDGVVLTLLLEAALAAAHARPVTSGATAAAA